MFRARSVPSDAKFQVNEIAGILFFGLRRAARACRAGFAHPANLSRYGYRCLTSFGEHVRRETSRDAAGNAGRMTVRITDQKGVSSVGGSRGVRGSGGTGARFTIDSGGATARMESKAPISILGGLEALIAIQSEDNAREKRRRSVKRGQSMLDLLDELKLALLAGQLPPDFTNRLSVLTRDSADSGDAALDSIMDSIELRAEVELAKLRIAARSRG